MKELIFKVLWFCLCLCFVAPAYPEHGLSISLRKEQPIGSGEWEAINGWGYYGHIGHFERGIKLDTPNNKIVAQKTGIYYVTFHISLNQHANSSVVAAATVVNGNIDKNIGFQASSDTGNHLTASGFISLQVNDDISIFIKTDSQYTVEKNSYIGMQFQGNPLVETGFLLSLDTDHELVNQDKTVHLWKVKSANQFSTWKIYHYGQESYQLPATGVYLFALNLIFKTHTEPFNISVRLFANDEVLSEVNHNLDADSTATINIHDIVHLTANTNIKVVVASKDDLFRIRLLHSSTFSMMMLKDEHSKGTGFHVSLKEPLSFTSTSDGVHVTPWETETGKRGHYEVLTGSDFSDKTFFSNMKASQVFYVTSQINFNIEFVQPHLEHDDYLELTFALQKDEQSIFQEKKLTFKLKALGKEATNRQEDNNHRDPINYMETINHNGTLNGTITTNKTVAMNTTMRNETIETIMVEKKQPFVIRLNGTIHLNGIYELNKDTPIGISVKSKNYKPSITLHKSSTFAAIQTIPDYPGAHGSLQGFKNIDTGKRYIVNGWNTDSTSYLGLYDFSESLDKKSGYYKVNEDGVYYAWANLVTSDIDSTIRLSAMLMTLDGNQVIRYKNSNPSQTTTISLGGIYNLKKGDMLYFEIHAPQDESWTIKTGGFTVTYISPKPIYFQVTSDNDQLIDNISDEDPTIVKFPFNPFLTESVFIVPKTGIYLMTANIILNKDTGTQVGHTTYEIFITIDNVKVEGIYSKKKTRSVTIEKYMTLFFSSSFRTVKGQRVALWILSDIVHKFKVSEGSSWSVAYIETKSGTSGALGTLDQVAVFQRTSSPTVGNWLYTNVKGGHFETKNGLQFNQKHITVLEEGLYAVALNLDISYRIQDPSTVIKVFIGVNIDDDVNQDVQNGLATWYTSTYPTQTLHACGTIFLHVGDKVRILIKSQHLQKVVVNKPSSISMVLIPEYVKSYSVAAYLTKPIPLLPVNQQLSGWEFKPGFASKKFKKENGETIIEMTGIYALRLFLPMVKFGSLTRTFDVNVTVNGKLYENYKLDLGEKQDALEVIDLLDLKEDDRVSITYAALIPFVNSSTIMVDTTANPQRHQNETVTNATMLNSTTTGVHMTTLAPTMHAPTHRPENYTVLVLPNGSAFSLIFMENAKISPSWKASMTNEKSFDKVGKTLLGPWSIPVDAENGGGSSGKGTSYHTGESGLYVLMLKTMVKNIHDNFSLTFKVGDNDICSSIRNCKSHCNHTFTLTCYANLSKDHEVDLSVMNDQPGAIIDKNTKRTITKISSEFNGINAQLGKDHVIDFSLNKDWEEGNWRRVGDWKTDGFGLFLDGIISARNAFVFTKAGTYQVSANVQVMYIDRNRTCSKNCHVTAEVVINDQVMSELFKTEDTPSNVQTFTISIVGNLQAKKWDKLSVKIMEPRGEKVMILKESTLSVILLEAVTSSSDNNHGPVLLSSLRPSNIETSEADVKRTWYCDVVGDSEIKYEWYKDNKILLHERSGNLTINGSVGDIGSYQCIASINQSHVKSNVVSFSITDRDECNNDLNQCSVHADCTNTFASYNCTCHHGYVGDGKTCNDFNECLHEEDNICHPERGLCINQNGTYSCECSNGWTGNGTHCEDVNECMQPFGKDICRSNSTCVNTNGSYVCMCDGGFIEINGTCSDYDECAAGTFQCGNNTLCNNTIGSYECVCKSGYAPGINGSDCTGKAESDTIIRSNSSDLVPVTKSDYTDTIIRSNSSDLVPVTKSDYFDECQLDNHGCDGNATCVNHDGGFNCVCNQGYSGNGTFCHDIDECANGTSSCDVNAYCNNTIGSFNCTCKDGYHGSGLNCSDINECETNTNMTNCGPNTNCINTNGSYSCECKPGFTESKGGSCMDIDECLESPCTTNADCINIDGSYECKCQYGWRGDGHLSCNDINECEEDVDICGFGNCTNTGGGHLCLCDEGYIPNGITCAMNREAKTAKQVDACSVDRQSFACLCQGSNIPGQDNQKRENNIMCNGLFAALLILVLVAMVVVVFVIKYIKSRKLRRIKPIKTHRDKYVEIENVSEV